MKYFIEIIPRNPLGLGNDLKPFVGLIIKNTLYKFFFYISPIMPEFLIGVNYKLIDKTKKVIIRNNQIHLFLLNVLFFLTMTAFLIYLLKKNFLKKADKSLKK